SSSSGPAIRETPSVVSSTGNIANDRLAAMSASEQAMFLGAATAEGCVGTRAFFMGTSHADHSAFWSVRCKNGKSYLVQIQADSTGSTRVLDCAIYKAVSKMSCFTKLEK